MALGFLFGLLKMVWNCRVVMVAKICEDTKNLIYTFKGLISWYVNHTSIKNKFIKLIAV